MPKQPMKPKTRYGVEITMRVVLKTEDTESYKTDTIFESDSRHESTITSASVVCEVARATFDGAFEQVLREVKKQVAKVLEEEARVNAPVPKQSTPSPDAFIESV